MPTVSEAPRDITHIMPMLLLVIIITTFLLYVGCRLFLLPFLYKLKATLTPIPDQWSLTTLDGQVFEEVDVEDVRNGEVIFRHRVGRTRLPIALLSEESQQKLHDGFHETDPSPFAATKPKPESAPAGHPPVPGAKPKAI